MLVTHSFDLLPSTPYHTKARVFKHNKELESEVAGEYVSLGLKTK